jgi:hypothetical protein
MELHRKPKVLIQPLLFMVFGLLSMALPSVAYLFGWVIVLGQFILWIGGGFCAIAGAYGVYTAMRTFHFRIDESGLSLRSSDLKGISPHISWECIDAIIVERGPDGGPRIVLVPVEDANIGVKPEYVNKVDGRPSVILIKMADVKETSDQIAAALRTYAGARFLAMT